MAVKWGVPKIKTKAGINSGKFAVKLPKSGPLRERSFTVPISNFTIEQVAKAKVLEAILDALSDWRAQVKEELDKQAPPTSP